MDKNDMSDYNQFFNFSYICGDLYLIKCLQYKSVNYIANIPLYHCTTVPPYHLFTNKFVEVNTIIFDENGKLSKFIEIKVTK
jgi:hypothetical protein